MDGRPNKLSQFWQELKRRKVIRVITVYAAAAFVIIELTNNITEPLSLPECVPTLVIVLLAIGFLISIVMSWIFDITPEGVQKTKPVSKKTEPKKEKLSSTMGWQIATYTSIVVIIGLLILNIVGRKRQAVENIELEESIAVLPFQDMSPQKDQEYFCDGMTEEIINSLTHIKDLRVIARTSSFAFKNKDVDIREIGEKLNVGTLLEGSVRKSGDRLRITAQLINAEDGSHIWSDSYDKTMKDIFDIQDEITLAIVDNLKIKLIGSEEVSIVKHYTDNPELYNLYLLGLHHANKWTPEDFDKSEEYFEQAIKKDPNYALAYVGIAEVNAFNTFFMSIEPKEAVQKAKEHLKTALRLEKDLAEAHAILGQLYAFYDWDWDRADEEFKKALNLNPNSVLSLTHYSGFLAISGQQERAVQIAKQAIELDPLSINTNSGLEERLIQAGHFDEAIDHLNQTIAMDPHWYYSYALLGMAYYAKSKIKEATEAFEKCYELSGHTPMGAVNLACAYYAQGKNQQGDVVFNEMKEIAKKEYVPASLFVAIYLVRGEMDEAYKWWKKACDNRDFMLPFFSSFKDPKNFWTTPDEQRFHDAIDELRKSK
jgi:adenylate cyclase